MAIDPVELSFIVWKGIWLVLQGRVDEEPMAYGRNRVAVQDICGMALQIRRWRANLGI